MKFTNCILYLKELACRVVQCMMQPRDPEEIHRFATEETSQLNPAQRHKARYCPWGGVGDYYCIQRMGNSLACMKSRGDLLRKSLNLRLASVVEYLCTMTLSICVA